MGQLISCSPDIVIQLELEPDEIPGVKDVLHPSEAHVLDMCSHVTTTVS